VNPERTYDLRLPTSDEVPKSGVVFIDKPRNWVQKSGVVREFLTLMYPQNGPIGMHASNDRKKSLCNVPVTKAETIDSGTAEKIATRVTLWGKEIRFGRGGRPGVRAESVQTADRADVFAVPASLLACSRARPGRA
jgi:hypothetical protein